MTKSAVISNIVGQSDHLCSPKSGYLSGEVSNVAGPDRSSLEPQTAALESL